MSAAIITPFRSRLTPFLCFGCGATCGYTSPGEAVRMSSRAHVFCVVCKDRPANLTERQLELLEQIDAIRVAKGSAPTYAEIAEAMGLSRSRVQSLTTAVRLKGEGGALYQALYGRPEPIAGEGISADPVGL